MSYVPYGDDWTKKTINGIDVWIPPEGYVYDPVSKRMVFIDVEGDGRPRDEQYWRRPTLPRDYSRRVAEMDRQRRHTPHYVDPVVASIRKREWLRRLGGYWFMNNGVPVYITGLHYFFLTYYRLDIGYPDFRITDRELLLMWDSIVDDPYCMGLLMLTRRRYGKTFIGGAILLEYITRAWRAYGGIQSKDDYTAKRAFVNAVRMPFRNLPDFFRPNVDNRVVSRLVIEESGSEVDYRAVGETAYDGTKLHRYVSDEFGKTVGANIVTRHNVIKYCLMDPPNIIGKAFYCTTVEDMAHGETVRQVEYMWDGSDHISGKNDYGMTATGLYRYMLPSYRSMNFNKYGFPDEKRNMKYIMAVRQAALASGDQKQYLGEVRKMPNTFQEAIMSSAVTNTFSNLVVTLAERAELLKAGLADDRVVRGRLEWTDGNDSDVVFVPSESGHWLMLKEYTSEEQAPKWFKPNNVSRYPGMIIPHGGDTFGIGVDPYAKSKANQAVQSNGAIAVFRKFDPMDERNSDMFVAVYCHRPHSLYEFYDEVLKGATYFGCPFLHEDNVSGIEDMALSRGYKQFLHTLPGRRSSGITSNHVTKPRLISFMEGYIEECVDKIYFIDLIEELIEYDAEDSHRFDLAAAAMIALMMCHRSRVDGVGLWGKKDDVRRYEDIYRSFIDISVF